MHCTRRSISLRCQTIVYTYMRFPYGPKVDGVIAGFLAMAFSVVVSVRGLHTFSFVGQQQDASWDQHLGDSLCIV